MTRLLLFATALALLVLFAESPAAREIDDPFEQFIQNEFEFDESLVDPWVERQAEVGTLPTDAQLKLVARTPDKARSLFGDGVEVVRGDVEEPDSLVRALEGSKHVELLETPMNLGILDLADGGA